MAQLHDNSNLLAAAAAAAYGQLSGNPPKLSLTVAEKPASPATELPAVVVDGAVVASGLHKVLAWLASSSGQTPQAEVQKWCEFATTLQTQEVAGKLAELNTHLLLRTFVASNQLTVADAVLYSACYAYVASNLDKVKKEQCNVARWLDHVQFVSAVSLLPSRPKLPFKFTSASAGPSPAVTPSVTPSATPAATPTTAPAAAHAAKPACGQEKAAEAKEGAGKCNKEKPAKEGAGKQDKKEQEPKKEEAAEGKGKGKGKGKQAPQKKEEAVEQSDISKVKIVVGKIVSIKKHPEADKLYVEEIDIGEGAPRQVVSGLVEFLPIDQLQGRLVVLLVNIKPSPLKGVLSSGILLAASNPDHTKVEVLDPPAGSQPGDRIIFEGETGEPEEQLNPKKKVWDKVKADLKTDKAGVATYKGNPFKTARGTVTVKTLTESTIG